MRKPLVFILVMLLCVLAAACSAPAVHDTALPMQTPAAQPTGSVLPAEIKLGAAHDLSGATALYGISIQKGVNLAIKQINEQELLGKGHTLKVAYEDTAGDPNQAVAAFKKLIANPEIVAILGPTLSSEAKAADPLAQQAGVPVIASSNTVTGIVEIGDYIFRTSLPESAVIPNTIDVAAKALNLKKVAIMYGNDEAFTQGGYQVFKAELDRAGIQILAEETFTKGDTDFSAQLARIKSLNPDAIIVSALAEEGANIMTQARTLGIPASVRFIGGNGFNSPRLAQIAGSAAEGAISGSAWNIASTFPASVDFVKAFRAEYDGLPDQFAAQAYTAAWVTALAIKNAGSVDRAAVRNALAQVKDFNSPLGQFSFNANRDPVHEPVVLVVKNGQFEAFQP